MDDLVGTCTVAAARRRQLPPLALTLSFIVLSFLGQGPSFGSTSGESERSFVDSVASTVFAFAWPSAEYERVSFGDVSSSAGETSISFRLHGKSAFGGGPLWVDVILVMRDGAVVDLRWGNHNAILSPPGATMKALGEALVELTKEYSAGQSSAPAAAISSPVGYRLVLTNGCRHPVRVAVRFLGIDGQWRTEGWWTFAPRESASLFSNQKPLLTAGSTWYYFAETTDGANLEWSGDLVTGLEGRSLGMRSAHDDQGDNEWTLECN